MWMFGWWGEGERNEERENEMRESDWGSGDYGDGSGRLRVFFSLNINGRAGWVSTRQKTQNPWHA